MSFGQAQVERGDVSIHTAAPLLTTQFPREHITAHSCKQVNASLSIYAAVLHTLPGKLYSLQQSRMLVLPPCVSVYKVLLQVF